METLSATPPANIYEAGGELSVAMPIPGAHPNHIEVVVRPNIEGYEYLPLGAARIYPVVKN